MVVCLGLGCGTMTMGEGDCPGAVAAAGRREAAAGDAVSPGASSRLPISWICNANISV